MEPAEAADLLGVVHDASDRQVRDAYRRAIRRHHPDVAGVAATDAAARLNAAYAVLRRARDAASASRPAPAPAPPTPAATPPPATRSEPGDVVRLVDDDTVGFSFPADEVFPLLVAVAEDLGEISYVDAENGILETIVNFAGEPVCSVVLSLQGRAAEVEAFCTVEALDGSAAPPVNEVVSLLVGSLRARLRSR